MATTQNTFTGDGSTTNFSFTFEYIKQADVKAKIDGVNTTAFTLANATTVSFTSAPSNGATIIVFRDTDNDEKTATFFAGSAIKAEDLNSNFDQVLFTAQEVDNNALQTLGGTMSGNINMGANTDIVFEGTTDNANETTLTVVDPTADRTITLPDVTGTVVTTGDTGTVATGMIADSAITSAKISDGTIATGDIADDAITTAKIADANVTTALIADASVTTAKLASNAVTTAKITDANVTTAKIADDAITAAKIAANAVGSSEIAANAVTSSELADASVDTAAIVDANVTTVKVADAAITTAKINDSAITSAKIGANQVVEGKIADNAVTTSKIPDSGITTPKIADNAVTNVKLADAELRELATMGSTTASALADLTQAEVQILDGATVSTDELNILDGVTANATEINQLDGNTLTNSFTANSTTQYPSSNAISGYVLGLMNNLGGFVAIANENSFPTTNPDPSDDAGTVVSISDAGGLVVSASGTASGQTTGGTAVTITGFPSALQSSTLPAGQGLQVVSTSTLNTYTYHKVLGTDADIAQLNDDVNDFFARYRIGSSNPTTDLDAGDLFFNTSTGKMLVYDTTESAWEEVQSVGSYFINTLSSSGGTGGGSATFNGSAYRFTLSNPGNVAQQHIVSINGVIQKPNSGTSQPSEGFAIDNADIILAAAPATGSEFFIVTVGTSVNIGTPSNDTITNAMVKADAAIAGTKISPNFGSQNVVTTGSAGIGKTPSTKLDILNGSDASVIVSIEGADSSSEYLGFGINSGEAVITAGGNGSTSNALVFRTAPSGTETERMRIDSSGFIHQKFTSNNSSTPEGLFINNQNNATGNNAALILSNDSGNRKKVAIAAVDVGNYGASDLVFALDGADSGSVSLSSDEKMRIDSSGNVGIATSSPSLALHVAGPQAYASGPTSLSEVVTKSAVRIQGSSNATTSLFFGVETSNANPYIQVANGNGSYSDPLVLQPFGGKVGIGTASPANPLHIADEFPIIRLQSDTGSYQGRNTIGGYQNLLSIDCDNDNAIANSAIAFNVDGSERMRIDSSGNVGIGNTDPGTLLHVSDSSDDGAVRVGGNNAGSTGLTLSYSNSGNTTTTIMQNYRQTSGNALLDIDTGTFTVSTGTSGTERMRIDSAGDTGFYRNTSSTSSSIIYAKSDVTTTNRVQWYVLATGTVENRTGTYTTISSDERMKKDIVDATSQWEDIKNIRMRKFRYKADGDNAPLQLGVVAQELETVCPNLVTRKPATAEMSAESEGLIAEGEDILSWKQSIVHLKALKALQEAMTRIETLETQNADLTARITALEEGS